jgi:hypothetical protein
VHPSAHTACSTAAGIAVSEKTRGDTLEIVALNHVREIRHGDLP